MGKTSKQTKMAMPQSNKSSSATKSTDVIAKSSFSQNDAAAEDLPPIGLVFTVIACSGFLFMFAFRDVFATGRNIGGLLDLTLLEFTKSTEFYDDSKGWKSTQGGLSAIQQVTTDANNMGGFFVRKIGGAAALAVQLQKLLPLLFHPLDARWKMGHFRPLFTVAAFANTMLSTFYALYMPELVAVGAAGLPKIFIVVLVFEALVILGYLFKARQVKVGHAVAMKDGKTPKSIPSRIVARTVALVSGAVGLIAGRDLFFPGEILDFVPRDDIYLEWTNAFLHSPPEGTPEARENGITTEFYIGDKFLSQWMALNLLIMCMYKFSSAFLIRYGSDGGGIVKARMIWKGQCVGNVLILYLLRLFLSSAKSASLDLRWHLMAFSYEACILGLFGFF